LKYYENTPQGRLGPNALAAFRAGAQGRANIVLPSIVLAELYYLNEKVGQPLDFSNELKQLQCGAQFIFVDFRANDIACFDQLATIPEMHDRIIAGVALARNCPCLTQDASIVGSGLIQTIW
jgi:predicted nucleic acid-binding protein